LHFAPGHLDYDSHVHVPALFDVLEAGADKLNLAILHLVQGAHLQILEGARLFTAKLDAHVGPPHPLALEGAAVRHGDGHLGDLDLDPTHFDAALYQTPGFLSVVFTLDVVERHGDDVLVLCHAGRQDLGDNCISDNWEAIVKNASSGCILQVVHLAQSQGKGKATELVV